MKAIAVIPARGGSKGIKNKNLKLFKGKPLIYWSIKSAQESKLIDDYYISTEDEKIKRVAKKYKCKVINRPKALSQSFSTTVSVLKHACKKSGGDIIICLQPTSPIRPKNFVDKMLKLFIAKKSDSLASGRKMHSYEWGKYKNLPRQKMKSWFWDDGLIYIFKKKILLANKWYGSKPLKVEISKKFNLIEIDDPIDLVMIKKIHE